MAGAEAEAPGSIDEALESLRKRFDPEAARAVRAGFQLELTGEGGGPFFLRIDEGALHLGPGRLEAPDVLFRLPAGDYFAVLAGRENADLLYLAGRLEIEGDLALAMKLRALFPAPR